MPNITLVPSARDVMDAGAFTSAAEQYLPKMLNLARRLAGQNAEDVVQDALARAWTKRHQFDPARGSFGSWLLAVTADRAYKVWRSSARHNAPLSVGAESPSPSVESMDLEASLRTLPKRQRLAVDCYYFVGLSVSETAVVMGCSEGTVKSTLSAARQALRKMLRYSP